MKSTNVMSRSVQSKIEPSGPRSQRQRIVHIAARLYAERGYNGVGMTELGNAVGLGRGAIYHHISSKEELLYEISRQYMSKLVEFASQIVRVEPDHRKRLQEIGKNLIVTIAGYRCELTVCFRESHLLTGEWRKEIRGLHAKYEHVWRRVLQEGAEAGVFRPFASLRLKGVLGMFFYSYIWIDPKGPQSPEEIADLITDMALRALA